MTFDGKVKDVIATPPSPFSVIEDDKHDQWIIIHFKMARFRLLTRRQNE